MSTLLTKWQAHEVAYAKLNDQGLAMLRMIHAVTNGASWQQQQQFARYAADLMACFASEQDYLNYIEQAERPKPAVKTVPVPRPVPPMNPPPPPSKPKPEPAPRPQPAPPLNERSIPKYITPKQWAADILPIWDSLTAAEQSAIIQNNPHLVGG